MNNTLCISPLFTAIIWQKQWRNTPAMEDASLGTWMPFPTKPMGQLKALLNCVERPVPFFFHWFAASSWTNHSSSRSLSFSICKMETERFLISPQMAMRHREKRNSYIRVGIIQALPAIITWSTGQKGSQQVHLSVGTGALWHILGPTVKSYAS